MSIRTDIRVTSLALVAGLALTATASLAGTAPASAAGLSPTRPWRVTLTTKQVTPVLGNKVWLHGTASKKAHGRLVLLQEKYGNQKHWHTQRTALVHRDGTFHTWDKPTRNKFRAYRAVIKGFKSHSRGTSDKVVVTPYAWVQLITQPAINQLGIEKTQSLLMNSVSYPASLMASMYYGGPTTQSIEFNLDHKCTKMRATYGISDSSQADSQASVTMSADGTAKFSGTFAVGDQGTYQKVKLGSPLKVRIDTASLVPGLNGLGAVGTPEVLCTR